MLYTVIIIAFLIGYLFIALEHTVKIDKAATALLTGTVCWVLLVFALENGTISYSGDSIAHFIPESIRHHIGDISEILFFLMGAMTIVEIIDAHEGFSIITDRISTTNKVKLIWILSVVTFFLSAVLDNLTTAIVMAALLKKMIADKEDLWLFAGMLIIAANAGGAWSPIGDVTTIMLWIGGQVTTLNIVTKVILPSLICLLVPLGILSIKIKGNIRKPTMHQEKSEKLNVNHFEKNIVFFLGIGALLFVPIFKTLTHLPPFMGILFGLGTIWVTTEIIHREKETLHKNSLSIVGVLQRIDTPSILFFLGILIAVASLQTGGHLAEMALFLDNKLHNIYAINTIIGILSAIVDNVPLVAGAMGMYSIETYPVDHTFWELLAYCAGTGGSILIIGSAAGVAIMGILKIDFIWYLKKISLLALAGYLAGIITYMLLN